MATKIVKVGIDWADAYGWQCPFCGADIDHLSDEENDEGTIDSSYTCQAPRNEQSDMCGNSYMVVRYDPKRRGDNGDALTIERFIEIWVDERYINKAKPVGI